MGVGYNPKIVTDGLVLCLDAANPKSYNYNMATYSQDFQNAVYTKSAGLITATGVLAPDGTLTATTMTDDDVGVYDNFNRTFTIPNDSSTYNISLYIRKTTGGVSPMTGFNINLTGGSLVNSFPRFNTDTGVLGGSNNMTVTSENNNYWRISFTVTNNSSGNTTLSISYFPATGPYNGSDASTATGSQTVWGFQVTRGAALLPYRLNVNNSATTWTDLSGNGNHGTLLNGPTFNAEKSGYLNFDGTDDYVNLTSASLLPVGTSDRTIVAFVRTPTSFPESYLHVIHWGTAAQDQSFGLAIFSNGGLNTHPWNGAPSQGTVVAGTDYCLAVSYTHSATLHKFWINGISQGAGVSRAINTGTTEANIGSRISGPIEDWGPNGRIYGVSVYNRTLTDFEIKQNFNAARGRFGI